MDIVANLYTLNDEIRSGPAKKEATFDTLSFDSDESLGECERLCHRELKLPSRNRQSKAPWREAEQAAESMFALSETPEMCAVGEKQFPISEGPDAQILADLKEEVSFLKDVIEDYGKLLVAAHAKEDAKTDDYKLGTRNRDSG